MTQPETSASWIADLRRGLVAGEVVPWYQPVVRIETGEIVGLEALARWRRPSQGTVEVPGQFVAAAERAGLVDLIDLAVLDHAVTDLERWRRDLPDLRLSVNCAVWVLDDPDGPDRVLDTIARHPVTTAGVAVELTETLRPRARDLVAAAVARLRAAGLEVWFDDFGTGWAELRHVLEVDVDGLKIDRFFTEGLDGPGAVVVEALLRVAQGIGLATVIEGVSTPEQAQRARELGCRTAQGFWWSEPLPAEQVDRLLAEGRPLAL